MSRQIPAEAPVIRPKKACCKMIGMGAELSTIVRAEAVDFFCDCRAVGVPSDERVGDVPGGVH
jgi:hypothetical protein